MNNSVTGTTTAAYVVALTINNCAGAVIEVTNTGATFDLKYKINGYTSAHASCALTAIKAETTLGQTVASGRLTDANSPYARIEVLVISAEATATTYQIDYIAY